MSMDLFEELLRPTTVSALLEQIFSNTFDEGLGGNWENSQELLKVTACNIARGAFQLRRKN